MNEYEALEVLVSPRQSSSVFMVDTKPHTVDYKISSDVCSTWPTYDLVPIPEPEFTHIIGGKVRIQNKSPLPITVCKNNHISDIRLVSTSKIPPFESSLYPRPKPSVSVCEVEKLLWTPTTSLHLMKDNYLQI